MVAKLDEMRLERRRVYANLFRLQGMSEAEVARAVERRLAGAHMSPKTLQKAMRQLAAAYKAKGARIPKPLGKKMQELQRRAVRRR